MKTCISILALLTISFNTLADSPLTSTDFYTAYSEVSIVQHAIESKGQIDNEIMLYISDRANPVDIKMAVINALGWNIDGHSNYEKYISFLEMRYSLDRESEKFVRKIDSDELLALAYLKALDNYFDVTEALHLAEHALNTSFRTQRSYTFNIITALIKSQYFFDSSWCDAYKSTEKVSLNKSLVEDFNTDANKIIFDYMILYKDYCNKN